MKVYTYKGDGTDYYSGVPARDLDDEDVALLTDEQRAKVDEGTLYSMTSQASRAANATATKPATKPTTQATVAAARGVTSEPDATDTPDTPATTEG